MKILLVSDSHGLQLSDEIFNIEQPDLAFHLGDSELEYNHKDLKQYKYKVRGNCDFDHNYPLVEFVTVNNFKLMLTHGHKFNINYNWNDIITFGKENNVNIIIHGHDHIAKVEEISGITIINPGSLRQSRNHNEETYAILDIDEDNINVTFKSKITYQKIDLK